MAIKVKVDLLSEKAVMPTRAHTTDTGYDITFTRVHSITGDVIFFGTDLSLQPSRGHYFEVVPRSSISKTPLSMANSIGVIDETYTGEILIPVRVNNHQPGGAGKGMACPTGLVKIFGLRPQSMHALADLILAKKPCMFQAILRKRLTATFEVEDVKATVRGDGGFGSTDEASEKESVAK
jgi:dUTPase